MELYLEGLLTLREVLTSFQPNLTFQLILMTIFKSHNKLNVYNCVLASVVETMGSDCVSILHSVSYSCLA